MARLIFEVGKERYAVDVDCAPDEATLAGYAAELKTILAAARSWPAHRIVLTFLTVVATRCQKA